MKKAKVFISMLLAASIVLAIMPSMPVVSAVSAASVERQFDEYCTVTNGCTITVPPGEWIHLYMPEYPLILEWDDSQSAYIYNKEALNTIARIAGYHWDDPDVYPAGAVAFLVVDSNNGRNLHDYIDDDYSRDLADHTQFYWEHDGLFADNIFAYNNGDIPDLLQGKLSNNVREIYSPISYYGADINGTSFICDVETTFTLTVFMDWYWVKYNNTPYETGDSGLTELISFDVVVKDMYKPLDVKLSLDLDHMEFAHHSKGASSGNPMTDFVRIIAGGGIGALLSRGIGAAAGAGLGGPLGAAVMSYLGYLDSITMDTLAYPDSLNLTVTIHNPNDHRVDGIRGIVALPEALAFESGSRRNLLPIPGVDSLAAGEDIKIPYKIYPNKGSSWYNVYDANGKKADWAASTEPIRITASVYYGKSITDRIDSQEAEAIVTLRDTYHRDVLIDGKPAKTPLSDVQAIIIKCPVDVCVLDADGEVLLTLYNSFDDVLMVDGIIASTVGDAKILLIPRDKVGKVSIQILPFDSDATMNIVTADISADSSVSNMSVFENVPLSVSYDFREVLTEGGTAKLYAILNYTENDFAGYVKAGGDIAGDGKAGDSKSGDGKSGDGNTDDDYTEITADFIQPAGEKYAPDYTYMPGSETGAPVDDRSASQSSVSQASASAIARPAAPISATVLVDGREISFDAYEIDGYNYFKLRDLAYTLSGTEKGFEVNWDGLSNAIALFSGQTYSAVGGEMAGNGWGADTLGSVKEAALTDSQIFLDWEIIYFMAYNIDGYNYFKLRDVGEAIDFGVDWDEERNTILIDTGKGYDDKYID